MAVYYLFYCTVHPVCQREWLLIWSLGLVMSGGREVRREWFVGIMGNVIRGEGKLLLLISCNIRNESKGLWGIQREQTVGSPPAFLAAVS